MTLEKLRAGQVVVSYLTVGTALVALILTAVLTFYAVRSYDRALAKAEERYAAFEERMEKREADWRRHEQERDEATAKQVVIERQIVYRDRETAKRITEVTAPERTLAEISGDVQEILGVLPQLQGELLAFTGPQVQQFTANKIELEACKANLGDTRELLALELQKTDSLQVDLASTRESLDESRKVTDAFKSAAKKSKARRVLDVFAKVGIFAAGVVIGRAIK